MLVPPVRLGRLLSQAREAQGRTPSDLARGCGLAYDESWFAELEAGRVLLDDPLVKWVSVALVAASVLVIGRQVPLAPALQALEEWVTGLGIWGPVVFALLYIAVTLLMGPAWAMTLAAGAIFGLMWGTIVASLASTQPVAESVAGKLLTGGEPSSSSLRI